MIMWWKIVIAIVAVVVIAFVAVVVKMAITEAKDCLLYTSPSPRDS